MSNRGPGLKSTYSRGGGQQADLNQVYQVLLQVKATMELYKSQSDSQMNQLHEGEV